MMEANRTQESSQRLGCADGICLLVSLQLPTIHAGHSMWQSELLNHGAAEEGGKDPQGLAGYASHCLWVQQGVMASPRAGRNPPCWGSWAKLTPSAPGIKTSRAQPGPPNRRSCNYLASPWHPLLSANFTVCPLKPVSSYQTYFNIAK